MDKKELKKYLTIGAIIIGVMIVIKNLSLIGMILGMLFSALYPLILGCIIAFVFNIFLSFTERHYFPKRQTGFIVYSRRPICLVISIAMMLLVIFVILKIVIPEVLESSRVIYEEIPPIFEEVKAWAIKNLGDIPTIQSKIAELHIDWESLGNKAVSFVTSGAGGVLSSVLKFIGSFTLSITNIVLAIIFAIYILICKDGIKKGFVRLRRVYIEKEKDEKLQHILDVTNTTFKSFFVGQFTEAIILGVLCMLGMFIFRFPYAMMTGTIIGVTALIPIVGAYVGGALGAFMILTVDPMKAVWFVVFLVILQQLEGNIIYPRVVGNSIGLPGIWVFAAVTVGGGLFGITGMLLGVPAFATVYKLAYETIEDHEKENGTYEEPVKKIDKPEKKRKKQNKKQR